MNGLHGLLLDMYPLQKVVCFTNDIHCCFTILVNLGTSFPCFTSACAEALVCHDQYLVKQGTFCSDLCYYYNTSS